MKFLEFILAALVAGASARTIAQPASPVKRQSSASSSPLPPSQDPWYREPADLDTYSPGAPIKVRSADGLVSQIANSSAAYQILYRTTDSQYNPTYAVTTLLIPKDANCSDSTTKSLLSYQIPYDSADVDDSPSYSLYSGGGLFGDSELSWALGKGYYVVTPDYEGPLASFTSGVISGHATLDSVRAVMQYSEFGLSNAQKALWGYSGGALAGEWGLELQVQYAPELTFLGAALGGTTPNVSSVLLSINGTVYAGLAPAGILGQASQFPEAQTFLESQLIDRDATYNKKNFNAAKNYSLAQDIGEYVGQNIGLYFKDEFDTLLDPIAQKLINTNGIMGYHGVPQFPLFVYKAIGDDISKIADTDKLVDEYCGVGATIDYQRNTVGDHATELINGRPRAEAFLTKLFEGTYSATGCTIMNVTVVA